MKLSAPTKPVFLISVALMAVGTASQYVAIPMISGHGLFVVLGGGVLLALATLLKGL